MLENEGVDFLFAPSVTEIYPDGMWHVCACLTLCVVKYEVCPLKVNDLCFGVWLVFQCMTCVSCVCVCISV